MFNKYMVLSQNKNLMQCKHALHRMKGLVHNVAAKCPTGRDAGLKLHLEHVLSCLSVCSGNCSKRFSLLLSDNVSDLNL